MSYKKTGRGKGRPPGARNKRTIDAQTLAAKLGINPLEILLRFADGDWEGLGYESATVTEVTANGMAVEVPVIEPDTRRKAAADATPYLHPRLKNIEHSGPGGGPIETASIVVSKVAAMDDQALEKELKRLSKSRA